MYIVLVGILHAWSRPSTVIVWCIVISHFIWGRCLVEISCSDPYHPLWTFGMLSLQNVDRTSLLDEELRLIKYSVEYWQRHLIRSHLPTNIRVGLHESIFKEVEYARGSGEKFLAKK